MRNSNSDIVFLVKNVPMAVEYLGGTCECAEPSWCLWGHVRWGS